MLNFFKKLFPTTPPSTHEVESIKSDFSVASAPEEHRDFQSLGKNFLANGQLGEAADAFRRAIGSFPDRAVDYINLGYVLTELKQNSEAEVILKKAVEIDPANTDGLYLLATLSRTMGKPASAILYLNQVLALRTDFEIAYSELYEVLLATDQDKHAKNVLLNAIEHFPHSAKFYYFLGNLLARDGAHDAAATHFNKALEIQPDYPELHFSLGTELQAQGNLTAAVESYMRAISVKPDYIQAHTNLGYLLLVLHRYDEAATIFDRAFAIDPNHLENLVNGSTVLLYLKRYEVALSWCDRALATRANAVEALLNRGVALKRLNRHDEALSSYDRALILKPGDGDILVNRGNVLQLLNRYEEALDDLDQALLVKPGSAELFTSRGASLYGLHRFGEALDNWSRAVELDSDFADAHYNESLCRLLLGEFETGWQKHEWRWRTDQFGHSKREFPQPLWLGKESLTQKTILLHAEQGLGDTIQFCRYAELVAAKGAEVILLVQPALRQLLVGLDGVSTLITTGDPIPAFDFHCPLLSLPLAFKTDFASIASKNAYIHPDTDLVQAWNIRLGKRTKPRIGLVWSGNHAHSNDQNRSVPLSKICGFLSSQAQFFSLQKEVRPADLSVLRQHSDIAHFGEELKSFADTAALISNMDLVISVDTSVAHLAGALGKPLWLLVAANSDWRWFLGRTDSPWYPTAKLFRQSYSGSMNQNISEVVGNLSEFINSSVWTMPTG